MVGVEGQRLLEAPSGPSVLLPGEMGIRHEDCIFITETAAECFTKWTGSPEAP